MITLLLYNVGS